MSGENAKVRYKEAVNAVLNYDIPEGKTAKGRGKRKVIGQDDVASVYKEKIITTQRGKVVTEKRVPMEATDAEVKEFLRRRNAEIAQGRRLEGGNANTSTNA